MEEQTGFSSQTWFYCGLGNELDLKLIEKHWNEDDVSRLPLIPLTDGRHDGQKLGINMAKLVIMIATAYRLARRTSQE